MPLLIMALGKNGKVFFNRGSMQAGLIQEIIIGKKNLEKSRAAYMIRGKEIQMVF